MNVSYLFNHATRSLRLCCRKPHEGEFPQELKRQFSSNRFAVFSDVSLFGSAIRRRFWEGLKADCNEKFIVMGEILTKQFNFYASQRLRRMSQVWQLYSRLYTEKSFRQIVSQLARTLREKQKRPLSLLLGVAIFNWENEKITDEEINNSLSELDRWQSKDRLSQLFKVHGCELSDKLSDDGWEPVIKKESLQVWRRPFPNTYLYEYKVLGTFLDVPARVFFTVQMDLDYRKTWDKSVIHLEVVDREEEFDSGCEVVHWVTHFPYPMYSRDYVYVRRAMVNPKTNTMVLVSRAVEHPSCPPGKKYVRVKNYSSRMVIRPHRNYDENGFDYVLTYFDDPQAAVPATAYHWITSSGVPDFVEKVHHAAKELCQQRRYKSTLPHSKSSNAPCPAGDVDYVYM